MVEKYSLEEEQREERNYLHNQMNGQGQSDSVGVFWQVLFWPFFL